MNLLEVAKAVVAAVVTAAVAALSQVDWLGIIAAAAAGGGLTWATPNKPRRHR